MRIRETDVGVAAAFGAVALWATNALAAKFALAELGVVQVLALQFGGATTVLAVLRVFRLERRKGEGGWRWSLLRRREVVGGACVGVVGLTGTIFLQYLAFDMAPIVEANVLAYGWPLFAALWAAVAYRSRRTLAGVPLAVVGFMGVVVILGSGGGLGTGNGGSIGYVAALASAGCMAFYTVMVGRSRMSAGDLLLFATTFGTICSLALFVAGLAPWQWSASNPGAWIASVYAGVGPMAGGFLMWSRAMSGDGAKRLAPLGYATPLLSTILLLLFGETFTSYTLLGASLVLVCSVGVLVVDRIGRSPRA